MSENVKKNGQFGFGINSCPVWLFKRLDEQAKDLFNDQYWVVLLDWYRKAEAYDNLVQGVGPDSVMDDSSVKDENENEPIKVFGKVIENGKV